MNFNDLNMLWSFECVTIHETWNIYDPLTWIYNVEAYRSELSFSYSYVFYFSHPHRPIPHQFVTMLLMDVDVFRRSSISGNGFFKGVCDDLRSKILYGMWNLKEDYGHGKVF